MGPYSNACEEARRRGNRRCGLRLTLDNDFLHDAISLTDGFQVEALAEEISAEHRDFSFN